MPTLLFRGTGSRESVSRMVALTFLMVVACTSDSVAPPAVLPKVVVASGNEQFGEPGAPLRDDIVVLVADSSGNPVSGVEVEWVPEDGGAISPSVSVTASNGQATAQWTLGQDTLTHRAVARVGQVSVATIVATSSLPPPPLGQIRLLELSTYDGSNQTAHPDFATADEIWPAPRRYLAITPYPNGNAAYENPSFYESFRSTRWRVPPGGANPVDLPAAPNYMSDPDIVFDPVAREFRLYYREVTGENVIWMMRSKDAVHWGERVLVARAYNHELISPSVVRRSASEWLMWSVNGNLGCPGITTEVEVRRSSDGISWSAPEKTSMSATGRYAWHVDVQWMPDRNEYWALFNKKEPGSCTTPELYLATSTDGVSWNTYPSPVLQRGAIPEFADIVYRATFSYNPANDVITFWYSGARYENTEYVWRSAVQRRPRAEVLFEAGLPFSSFLMGPRRNVPPLMIAP